MFLFWCIISAMTLLALSFVVRPLFFIKGTYFQNTEDLKSITNIWLILSFLLFIPLFSILFYLYLGKSGVVIEWLDTVKNANQVKAKIEKLGSRQNIIQTLRVRLMELPENKDTARGWYILGKLYFSEKNQTEAIACLRKASKLKPDPEYLLQYVTVKFYIQQQLDKEDKQILNSLLQLSPNNINAINLLASDAYQKKNYPEAIHRWESLLKYFPAGSEDSKNLLLMIRQAQRF